MTIKEWLYIGYIVVAAIITITSTVMAFIKAAKAKYTAKTANEKALADADMKAYANKLIVEAEQFYNVLDVALKAQGESAGPYKKESVMAKLQEYATSKNLAFDKEYWSTEVDNIVTLTKNVNAK